MMNGWIGITDNERFDFLSRQPEIDKVNFWQPGGKTLFKALSPGEAGLFKLPASPHHGAGGCPAANLIPTLRNVRNEVGPNEPAMVKVRNAISYEEKA